MSRRTKAMQLFQKAESALLSGIEVYNKPDFKYREETFAILILNAWELLLKAKLLHDNNNDRRCLYEYQPRRTKKGELTKKKYAVLNRSGSAKTKGLGPVIVELDKKTSSRLAPEVKTNLDAVGEIRDNAVHYYNARADLAKLVLEIGTASIRNFIELARRWFNHDMSGLSLYLLPIGFVSAPVEITAVPASSGEAKLIGYLRRVVAESSGSDKGEFSVGLNVNVSFRKAGQQTAAALNVTRDPNAPKVQISEEDIRKTYAWSYRDMCEHLKKRYTDFKQNKKFNGIHRQLKAEPALTRKRYLDPARPSGSHMTFYNPNIVREYDKHYTRK